MSVRRPTEVGDKVPHVPKRRLDLGRQLVRDHQSQGYDVVELAQDLSGSVRKGIEPFLRQVESAPDIPAEKVQHHHPRHQGGGAGPETPVGAPSGGQPLAADDADRHGQEQSGRRQEVDHIPQVHHAAGHALEVSHYREI